MNKDEIKEKFGISEKLAYGLFIQSIILIISTIMILTIISLAILNNYSIETIFPITFQLLTCILLLTYSFYGFNKKNQEMLFKGAIISYMIFLLLSFKNINTFLSTEIITFTVLRLILLFLFLVLMNRNVKVVQVILLVEMILEVIVGIYLLHKGFEISFFIKNIVVPFSII